MSQQNWKTFSTLWGAGLLALALLLGPAAVAAETEHDSTRDAEPAEPARTPEHRAAMAPHAGHGMTVVLDEVTGELRAPTAEESERFFGSQKALSQDDGEIETFVGVDGSVGVRLDGRFLKHTVATVDSGQIHGGQIEHGGVKVQHDVVLIETEAAPEVSEAATEEKTAAKEDTP